MTLRPGTMAWADIAPGLRLPGPHPVLILKTYPSGNCDIAFISHSDDLVSGRVPITRPMCPHAFRENGGPLTAMHALSISMTASIAS